MNFSFVCLVRFDFYELFFPPTTYRLASRLRSPKLGNMEESHKKATQSNVTQGNRGPRSHSPINAIEMAAGSSHQFE